MRKTRIKIFKQMELEACKNELDWMAKMHDCVLNNCPEEDFPPMPLLIPSSYYVIYLERRAESRKWYNATYFK